MTIEQDWAALAEANIVQHGDAGKLYATLAGQEMLMEAERTELKAKLISALVGTEDEQGKRHSATSAEKAAGSDPRYLAHIKALSETVVNKNAAKALKDSAYLRATLAIAVIQTERVGVA